MKNIKNMLKKKNITIEDLAVTVNELSVTVKNLSASVKETNKTIENFAIMVQKGFMETNSRIDDVKNELKEEINIVREEEGNHFTTLKNILYRAHDNRIEKIEDDVRILKTALKI